jgi:predicted dehydrogenase
LHWPDGAAVNANVGYGKTVETISIAGSEGTLTMYQPHGRIWKGRCPMPAPARLRRRVADFITMSSYAIRPARTLTRSTTLAALGSFLGCLRTGTASNPNLADALRVARILAAAEQSLASATPVQLAA